MATENTGGAAAEPVRFISREPGARPPAASFVPGVVEVEFEEHVRPQMAAPTALASRSGADLSPLNAVLQRHGLERVEPSFLTTEEAADAAQAVAQRRGANVPHYGNFVTMYFPASADLRQVATELNQVAGVARAVPVPTALPPTITVTDPLLGSSDQVVVDPNTGLEHQWYIFRCHANQAWNDATGQNVVIADVDWGVRPTHQDLEPQLEMAHAYNAFDGGTNVTTGGSVFHGCGVLGLAGAANNGAGMTGIAFGAKLWPIQGDSGPGTALAGNSWARGIEHVRTADSGGRRKVIILEVQTGAFGNYESVPSVNVAIRTAIASGVVVCVAAGNGDRDAALDDMGNAIPETGSILVGATAYDPSTNPRASFSNWGPRIVVAAPGDGSHDLTCNNTSDTAYRNAFGGTSGATPKVAATAALMLEANPTLDHATIREILNGTGTAVVTAAGKPVGTFLNTAAAVAEARARAGAQVFLDGTPAVRQDAAGRLQLFVRGRPEAMLSNIFQLSQTAPNNGWSGWVDLGHGFESASPSLGRNADGRLEAFAQASIGLFHTWELTPGGGWSGWQMLTSGVSATPASASNADGRLEAFGVALDGALHHIYQTAPNNGWSTFDSLGGSFTFPIAIPAVGASADGRLEVFVIAPDGTLSHIFQQVGGGWSAWLSHGGSLAAGGAAVASNADGRLELAALGTDGSLQHIWQTAPNGSWSGWGSLGGAPLATASALGTNADGRLEAFAVAADGSLRHIWQMGANGAGGWSSWDSLGTPGGGLQTDAAPGLGRNADGRLEVFAVGADSQLYHIWQTAPNGGWSGWGSFGRPTV